MGEKASMWNLWHGCHKLSEGCRHCYVYRTDGKYGKDSSVVTKTESSIYPCSVKRMVRIRYLQGIWYIPVLLQIFSLKMRMNGVPKRGR